MKYYFRYQIQITNQKLKWKSNFLEHKLVIYNVNHQIMQNLYQLRKFYLKLNL